MARFVDIRKAAAKRAAQEDSHLYSGVKDPLAGQLKSALKPNVMGEAKGSTTTTPSINKPNTPVYIMDTPQIKQSRRFPR